MRTGALRWLSATGFRTLRWHEWGPEDGAPVICVHGLTRTGRDFDALAEVLAGEGRRVLCPDLPGRGISEWLSDPALYIVPTYVAALSYLLARLKGDVDWVGTSLGGICGMAIAATPDHPVRRLVLNDVGAMVPQEAVARIASYVGTEGEFADLPDLEAHLRRVHAPFGPLTDEQWRHLAETSARPVAGGRAIAMHYDPAIAIPFRATQAEALDLTALWQAVDRTTLLIRGAESDVLPAEIAARMAERPGVRLEEVAGCGHAPALMDPAQIAMIVEFLAG